ncbi:MAG: hypothetical protein ACOX2N_00935 [Peptococcia bacterium]|jgi:hypothetical protein
MGLYDKVIKRLEGWSESNLNKAKIDDFDLLYRDNLEKKCNIEEIERIKAVYMEWRKLGDKLRTNELTPPTPEETQRIIELELFLNNLNKIVNSGQLNEKLRDLEQDRRTSISDRMRTIGSRITKDNPELRGKTKVEERGGR